jgi:5'-nucleotidase/UDP-sugar diphosphatase
VARRATVIEQERHQGLPVLILDAGDSLSGDVDPARATQGQTSVAAMNRLGYDAMALGPQDLALGLSVLRERIAEANFAVLSANAVETATGRPVATPYVVRELDGSGLRVGIIGLSSGPGDAQVSVADPLETAEKIVPEVAAEAEVVIVLSHAGLATDQRIAETVPGIDVIISGASYVPGGAGEATAFETPWYAPTTGVLVVQADDPSPGHTGRRLGVARLSFDSEGQVTEQTWQRLLLGQEIADDAEMAQWVEEVKIP